MSISNKTILITRTREQSKNLITMLQQYEYEVLNVPTIKMTDPEDPEHLRNVLDNISAYVWIIFTSANAVRYFFKFKNKDDNDLQQIDVACVGKKTGEVLSEYGIEPDLIPSIFSNQGLLEAIKNYNIRGKHIMLPVSNAANEELQLGLEALGAHVKKIEVYKNQPFRDEKLDSVIKMIEDNALDCLSFYSPSAFNAFADLIGDKYISTIRDKNIPIAVIGLSTAQAVRDKNLHPEIMPDVSDDEHFVQAIKMYFGAE
jgi:uroporphyrinogen-III synthase